MVFHFSSPRNLQQVKTLWADRTCFSLAFTLQDCPLLILDHLIPNTLLLLLLLPLSSSFSTFFTFFQPPLLLFFFFILFCYHAPFSSYSFCLFKIDFPSSSESRSSLRTTYNSNGFQKTKQEVSLAIKNSTKLCSIMFLGFFIFMLLWLL